jgi:hypothetical protein
MPRRDQQPELGERPATKRQVPPSGRGIGERFAGAFVGGLFGVPLGFILSGIHFFAYQGAFRYDLVGATVLYSAVFTFIFGEMLGDAWMGMFRLFQIAESVRDRYPYGHRDFDAGSWIKSLMALVLFIGPLILLLYVIVRHHPG